jgi:hypothetical protein
VIGAQQRGGLVHRELAGLRFAEHAMLDQVAQ